MQPVKLINGRTPAPWAAYDRAKLIGAVSLGLLLVVLSMAGRGPAPAGGCCGPPAAAVVDPGCADALESDVLFATDSAELTLQGRAMLARLAPCWRGGRFEVEGHTDSTGTDAINQDLSERRARAVADQLIKGGIDASALTARGYGSSRPVADNATPEGRAKNRRVEFHRQ